jgi:hypothetical protein
MENYVIKSSLGNYLRTDKEAITADRDNAARFGTEEGAYEWILNVYGRNGTFYFFPTFMPKRERRDNDKDEARDA